MLFEQCLKLSHKRKRCIGNESNLIAAQVPDEDDQSAQDKTAQTRAEDSADQCQPI
jgi:hypothetical protein